MEEKEKKETENETSEEKVDEQAEQTIVVKELPSQEVRKGTLENGSKINMITTEEALTEIYNRTMKIEKAVA